MQQGLSLLLAQLGVGVVEDEPDGREKVALPRAIPTYHRIVPRAKRPHDHLVAVGLEPVDR